MGPTFGHQRASILDNPLLCYHFRAYLAGVIEKSNEGIQECEQCLDRLGGFSYSFFVLFECSDLLWASQNNTITVRIILKTLSSETKIWRRKYLFGC